MSLEDRGTGDAELAAEIAVLEDLPQRGRVVQGLLWLRELQKRRAATTADRERVRAVVEQAVTAAMSNDGKGGFVLGSELSSISDRVAEQLSATVDIDRAFLRRILSSTKHGPGGRGGNGSCDTDCVKCEAERRFDHPRPHHAGRQAIPVINPSDTPELREAIARVKEAAGGVELLTVSGAPVIRDFASAPAVKDNQPVSPGSLTTGSNGGLGGGGGSGGVVMSGWIIRKKELDASIPGQPANPGWQARVHAAADKIDRGANVVATPPDEEHPLGRVSVTPRRIAVELVLAKLEKAAKAATDGKWELPKQGPGLTYNAVVSNAGPYWDEGYGGSLIGESFRPANGAYVVDAQPAAILALIATVREMIPLVKDWAAHERAEANRLGIVDTDFDQMLNRALTVEVP